MDGIINRNITKALSANRMSSSIHAEGGFKSPLHKKEGLFTFTPLHRETTNALSRKRDSIIEDEVFVAGLTLHNSSLPPLDLTEVIERDGQDIPSSKSFSSHFQSPNHSPALVRCNSIPDDLQHHQLVFQFGTYNSVDIALNMPYQPVEV